MSLSSRAGRGHDNGPAARSSQVEGSLTVPQLQFV